MKLKKIEKKYEGRYLAGYDLHYAMADGHEKVYEMVSRTPLHTAEDIGGRGPDGVVMVIWNREKTRILLNREFRPAVNRVLYNFPAGLMEQGEDIETAARRELLEETGLHLTASLACYGDSYGSVGISNESAAVFFGQAEDSEPFGGNHDPAEEIEPVWLTRGEADEVARGGAVTARVQMLLALWASDLLSTRPKAGAVEE